MVFSAFFTNVRIKIFVIVFSLNLVCSFQCELHELRVIEYFQPVQFKLFSY